MVLWKQKRWLSVKETKQQLFKLQTRYSLTGFAVKFDEAEMTDDVWKISRVLLPSSRMNGDNLHSAENPACKLVPSESESSRQTWLHGATCNFLERITSPRSSHSFLQPFLKEINANGRFLVSQRTHTAQSACGTVHLGGRQREVFVQRATCAPLNEDSNSHLFGRRKTRGVVALTVTAESSFCHIKSLGHVL